MWSFPFREWKRDETERGSVEWMNIWMNSRVIKVLMENSKRRLGSGCGSVGRAAAFNTRGPRFDSSHRQKFIYTLNICLLSTVYWKDENKEKEAGNGPFFKKKNCKNLPRRTLVSIESLKGMYDCFLAIELMQFPRAKRPLFMLFASARRSPWAWVFETDSEPAKSTFGHKKPIWGYL